MYDTECSSQPWHRFHEYALDSMQVRCILRASYVCNHMLCVNLMRVQSQAIASSNVLDAYIALYIDPESPPAVSGAAFDVISYLHNFIDEETFVDAEPPFARPDLASEMATMCALQEAGRK